MSTTARTLRLCTFLLLAALLGMPAHAAEGTTVDIAQLLDRTGARLEWDEFTRTGVLWSGLESIGFAPGEEVAVADFSELIRIEPIVYDRGRLLVPEPTYELLAERLGEAEENARLRPVRAIVIDAGHGGRDPGTLRSVTVDGNTVTYYEKDLVLDMARRVKRELEAQIDGPEVHLSRDADVYLTLGERTEFAHSLRTDPLDNVLFVSLHVNASAAPWTETRGVEIYYLPATQRRQVLEAEIAATLEPEISSILNDLKEEEYTVESVLMGKTVLGAIAEMVPETPVERGVRVANFFVVREARMPSILIETGFINNRQDLELLTTPSYRQRLSEAIAAGIASYVRDFEQVR
ncbi:MAG: N-acetylmuramoyl-L-alanine amidase family protein [Spirochaetota bacterium]